MQILNDIREFMLSRSFLLVLLFVLCMSASFLLGQMSQQHYCSVTNRQVGAVIYTDQAVQQQSQQVVASRNGSTYHLLWCAGASRIGEQNKVYFDNAAAAEAAGYRAAKNCPGLSD